MPRPKPEEMHASLTVRLPVSLLDRYKKIALDNDLTVSFYIRRLLTQNIDALEKDNNFYQKK